jgi:hypothetical protein
VTVVVTVVAMADPAAVVAAAAMVVEAIGDRGGDLVLSESSVDLGKDFIDESIDSATGSVA